ARSGEVETALDQYSLCENAWRELGRLSDAGEAALEAVLVAADVPKRADRSSATFIPTLDSLSARLKRGQEFFGQESALLALAQARVAYFSGEAEQAETDAARAFQLATEGGHREWAWRASSLRALI